MSENTETTIKADLIPITELREGHQISGGGIVLSTRKSTSGKTVFVTYRRPNGEVAEYKQSSVTRCAIFTEENAR